MYVVKHKKEIMSTTAAERLNDEEYVVYSPTLIHTVKINQLNRRCLTDWVGRLSGKPGLVDDSTTDTKLRRMLLDILEHIRITVTPGMISPKGFTQEKIALIRSRKLLDSLQRVFTCTHPYQPNDALNAVPVEDYQQDVIWRAKADGFLVASNKSPVSKPKKVQATSLCYDIEDLSNPEDTGTAVGYDPAIIRNVEDRSNPEDTGTAVGYDPAIIRNVKVNKMDRNSLISWLNRLTGKNNSTKGTSVVRLRRWLHSIISQINASVPHWLYPGKMPITEESIRKIKNKNTLQNLQRIYTCTNPFDAIKFKKFSFEELQEDVIKRLSEDGYLTEGVAGSEVAKDVAGSEVANHKQSTNSSEGSVINDSNVISESRKVPARNDNKAVNKDEELFPSQKNKQMATDEDIVVGPTDKEGDGEVDEESGDSSLKSDKKNLEGRTEKEGDNEVEEESGESQIATDANIVVGPTDKEGDDEDEDDSACFPLDPNKEGDDEVEEESGESPFATDANILVGPTDKEGDDDDEDDSVQSSERKNYHDSEKSIDSRGKPKVTRNAKQLLLSSSDSDESNDSDDDTNDLYRKPSSKKKVPVSSEVIVIDDSSSDEDVDDDSFNFDSDEEVADDGESTRPKTRQKRSSLQSQSSRRSNKKPRFTQSKVTVDMVSVMDPQDNIQDTFVDSARQILSNLSSQTIDTMTPFQIGGYVLRHSKLSSQIESVKEEKPTLHLEFQQISQIMKRGLEKGLTVCDATSVFGSLMNVDPGFDREDVKKLTQREQRFYRTIFHFIMYLVHIYKTNRQACLFPLSLGNMWFVKIFERIMSDVRICPQEYTVYNNSCEEVFNLLSANNALGPFAHKRVTTMPSFLIDLNYKSFKFENSLTTSFKEEFAKGLFSVEDYLRKDKGAIRGWLHQWKEVIEALAIAELLTTKTRTRT